VKSEASTFEDLEVFRRAYRVSLDLHQASLLFPKVEQFAGLADQMRRASKSICGNIAEGYGKRRRSKAEFKRYLLMAIGSADEMQVWLRYCADLEYIDRKRCVQWRNEYREIARMLQGLYTRLSSSSDP
jgi:four helix bundle protein